MGNIWQTWLCDLGSLLFAQTPMTPNADILIEPSAKNTAAAICAAALALDARVKCPITLVLVPSMRLSMRNHLLSFPNPKVGLSRLSKKSLCKRTYEPEGPKAPSRFRSSQRLRPEEWRHRCTLFTQAKWYALADLQSHQNCGSA